MKIEEHKRTAVVLGMMRGVAKNDPATAKRLAEIEAEAESGVIKLDKYINRREFGYLVDMFECALEAYNGA